MLRRRVGMILVGLGPALLVSAGVGALIRSWVRASRPDMDVVVYRSVSAWLRETWPFENPDYAAKPETSE